LRQANELIKYITRKDYLTGRKNITFTCEGLRRYARADSLHSEHYHYRL